MGKTQGTHFSTFPAETSFVAKYTEPGRSRARKLNLRQAVRDATNTESSVVSPADAVNMDTMQLDKPSSEKQCMIMKDTSPSTCSAALRLYLSRPESHRCPAQGLLFFHPPSIAPAAPHRKDTLLYWVGQDRWHRTYSSLFEAFCTPWVRFTTRVPAVNYLFEGEKLQWWLPVERSAPDFTAISFRFDIAWRACYLSGCLRLLMLRDLGQVREGQTFYKACRFRIIWDWRWGKNGMNVRYPPRLASSIRRLEKILTLRCIQIHPT